MSEPSSCELSAGPPLVWHTHCWIGHRALFGMSDFRNSPLGEFRQRKGNRSLLHVLPWPGSALLFRAVRDVTCRGVKAGRGAASSAGAVLQLVGGLLPFLPLLSLWSFWYNTNIMVVLRNLFKRENLLIKFMVPFSVRQPKRWDQTMKTKANELRIHWDAITHPMVMARCFSRISELCKLALSCPKARPCGWVCPGCMWVVWHCSRCGSIPGSWLYLHSQVLQGTVLRGNERPSPRK